MINIRQYKFRGDKIFAAGVDNARNEFMKSAPIKEFHDYCIREGMKEFSNDFEIKCFLTQFLIAKKIIS